jgi:hypothetical protein
VRFGLVLGYVLAMGCSLDRSGIAPPNEQDGDGGCPPGWTDRDLDGTCDTECTPTGPEICDGIDNDCMPETVDGAVDARLGLECDGGDTDLCNEGVVVCVSGETVCEDFSDNTPETCSPDDEDCDGRTDEGDGPAGGDGGGEGLGMTPLYPDADGDGHGAIGGDPIYSCELRAGYSRVADDCNDAHAGIHPDAPEACNEQDENCNGIMDDGPGCDCARMLIGERTFAFCTPLANFDGARAFCTGRSLALASIHSPTENEAIFAYLARSGTSTWWIGARQAPDEGPWSWIDTSAFDFDGFSGGEPNCWYFENCTDIDESARHWRDAWCQERRPAICATPP